MDNKYTKSNVKSFYIWPLKYTNDSSNPYLKYLEEALSQRLISQNAMPHNKKWRGVLNLLLNLKADLVVLNWPENIIYQRFGFIQIFIFALALCLYKLKKKDIVWIVHNKNSHNQHILNSINVWILKLTASLSTVSFVHAEAGTVFYRNKYAKDNIKFVPHPAYPAMTIETDANNQQWDYMIWGRIEPYKNILGFLEYFTSAVEHKNSTLLICGSCKDQQYLEKINALLDERITFINEYVSDDDLYAYMYQSNCILFTYSEDSIICSGALILSLNTMKLIIGPNVGFFKELADQNVICTYESFSDISKLNDKFSVDNMKSYITDNTWASFADKIINAVSK